MRSITPSHRFCQRCSRWPLSAVSRGSPRAIAIVPLHVPLDPNEGWNAYHTVAAIAGHGPYPAGGSFMVNNYPPLSFYLVGLLGRFAGDQIVAGRIISLASFVCICGFATMVARRLCGSLQDALLSAILLAATLFLTSDYVGMDDPQLLGHAFQLAALFLVLREPRTASTMVAAALLFVAGGFVKHNLFVLPLATVIWLALFDRHNALRLVVCGIVLSFCGLAIFRLVFGFDLLHRLASARLWSFAQLASSLAAWLPFVIVPMIGLAGLVLWRPRDAPACFVAIYAVLAICAGAIFAGGAGVDMNAMFDADIALALGAGLALGELLEERRPVPHLVGRAFALAALIPFVLSAFQSAEWREGSFWRHPLREETSLAAQDINFLRAHPGPAICETLASCCYWGGETRSRRCFQLLDQQLRARERPRSRTISAPEIAAHRFAAIELDETDPFPLPRIVQSAILYNYRIDHNSMTTACSLLPR